MYGVLGSWESLCQVRRDLATLYERMAEWKPDLVSAKDTFLFVLGYRV